MAKTTRRGKSKTASKSNAKKATPSRARAKAATAKGTRFHSAAIGLTANDIAASLSWYCDVVGFAVKERWEQKGALMGAELRAGDARVFVGQDDWQKGRDRAKGEGVRFFLHVKGRKDVDRLADAIKARGGTLASEPEDVWGARAFSLVDPTGYKLTISSAE